MTQQTQVFLAIMHLALWAAEVPTHPVGNPTGERDIFNSRSEIIETSQPHALARLVAR